MKLAWPALRSYPFSMYQFIHATWSQGCPDSIHHRNTSIDVADELSFALTGIGTLFQQDDLRLLRLKQY